MAFDLSERIHQAIADPRSVVGPRNFMHRDGEPIETIAQWQARAVLVVLASTGMAIGPVIGPGARVSGTWFGQAFKGTVTGTYTSRDGLRLAAVRTDNTLSVDGYSANGILMKASELTVLDD